MNTSLDSGVENPQRELTRQFIHQIRETTFVIETEHFDWYAMIAQMEQFCQRYNLSSQQINSVLHIVDESLAILGTSPGMRLTLAYTEQDDTFLISRTGKVSSVFKVFKVFRDFKDLKDF